MIIENNDNWYIVAPIKTGRQCLENALLPNHAWKRIPDSKILGISKRILIVRNPLERWSSIYWKCLQIGADGSSTFLANESSFGIQRYAEAWLHLRETNRRLEYTSTFCEMADQMGANEYGFTEKLDALLNTLNVQAVLRRCNHTRSARNWQDTAKHLHSLTRQAILTVYKEDLKRWYNL